MKLFLEEERELDGEKVIVHIKEVPSHISAIKGKTANKCFLHQCFHDERPLRPCIREVI